MRAAKVALVGAILAVVVVLVVGPLVRRENPGGEALEELSKRQLYERAQRAGIGGRSRMSKAELLEALRSAEDLR